MPLIEDENSLTSAGSKGRNSRLLDEGASKSTASRDDSSPRENQLMEEVLSKDNLIKAMKQVEANKGAAGVDDMTVGELKAYLQIEWPRIRRELLERRYEPKPVRRVMIPKAGGGERALGIPTVVDRLIQQADPSLCERWRAYGKITNIDVVSMGPNVFDVVESLKDQIEDDSDEDGN